MMSRYPGIYVIGLTGGIACGKSTISEMLKHMGAVVIDADKISKEVTSPGSLGLKKIVSVFGDRILEPDGSLDRRELGQVVFRDKDALCLLNSIIHPIIIDKTILMLEEESQKAQKTGKKRIVVLDAPLLLEVGAQTLVDEVWVVSLDEETQVTRLMKREGYSKDEALSRIRSQMPLAEKEKMAQLVIDNSASIESVRQTVSSLFLELRRKLGIE